MSKDSKNEKNEIIEKIATISSQGIQRVETELLEHYKSLNFDINTLKEILKNVISIQEAVALTSVGHPEKDRDVFIYLSDSDNNELQEYKEKHKLKMKTSPYQLNEKKVENDLDRIWKKSYGNNNGTPLRDLDATQLQNNQSNRGKD